MTKKPKPLTGLERLLYKAFLTEVCKGHGDAKSMQAWTKRTARKIFRTKISQLS